VGVVGVRVRRDGEKAGVGWGEEGRWGEEVVGVAAIFPQATPGTLLVLSYVNTNKSA
jgi:hypothetical protein